MRKKAKPTETTVIYDYIKRRIKRGLGVNAIIIGPPGIGKSYVCLRVAEKIHKDLHNEELDVKKHVVYDLPSAFRFVRNVKRKGEVLVIEEVSVIASARRSMATENVSLNYLLDTVRKKQVILLLNGPHIKAIDKHIQRMSHLLIELLRINKNTKLSTAKAFTLTNSQDTGKVYKHRFRSASKQVHRSYFRVPSLQIRRQYETMKNEFMENLYQKMEEKNLKKAGIKKEKEDPITLIKSKLPSTEALRRYGLYKKLGSLQAVADHLGKSVGAIKTSIDSVKKKTGIEIVEERKEPIKIQITA